MFIICSYIRFPLYIFAHLQIYIIRTKLRNIRSSFFHSMLKSSFCRWLFGRSPLGRAFRCKSSLCCGLSPAIPNVGERAFTVLHLHLGHGLFRPGVRFRPLRETAWPKPDIGRKDKRNTSVRAVTRGFGCSPKPSVPSPVRKSSPVFVRQPTLFKVIFYNIFYQQHFSLFP